MLPELRGPSYAGGAVIRPLADARPRVLIVGGAGGMGLSCATGLAAAGAELVICDVDEIALALAARRLRCFVHHCDALDEDSIAAFASEIESRFRSVDILINAAGRGYVRNLAMMRMTVAFLPMMRRATGKRLIINLAPADGFTTDTNLFPYAGSRVAFESLCEAITRKTKGTAIHPVKLYPKILRASTPDPESPDQSYRLQRADGQELAERVKKIVEAARG